MKGGRMYVAFADSGNLILCPIKKIEMKFFLPYFASVHKYILETMHYIYGYKLRLLLIMTSHYIGQIQQWNKKYNF
jgi:hypothetical protein